MKPTKPLWIMIAGPYRAGASNATQRAENLRRMNEVALEVFRLGHIPVIGVNAALPILQAAEADAYDEIMMPVCLALAERCDAILRIGGESEGADQELASFEARGLPVFRSVSELPKSSPS